MKTIGIIGGFGPLATAEFYLRLVREHRQTHGGHQPRVMIHNVAVPRHLEQELLIFGKSDNFAPLLITAAKMLEQHGADFIVLPCNTLHIHEEKIKRALSIPFVSIIKETALFLKNQNIHRIGFIGSQVTLRENLFQKLATSTKFVTVDKKIQKKIDRGLDIFVGTQEGDMLEKSLHDAFLFLKNKNLKEILVACTDFHGFCPTFLKTHDTLDILVRATINMV